MNLSPLRWLPVVCVASVLLVPPNTSLGGSVFLKNGYIVQGDVVDRDDGKVVLGWQNGKMVIYQRFIDDVVLEPGEEARIAQRRLAVDQSQDSMVRRRERQAPRRLPDSLDTLLASRQPARTSNPGSRTPGVPMVLPMPTAQPEPVVVDPIALDPVRELDPTSHGELAAIPPPAQELVLTELGFAITPPSGWEAMEETGRLRLQETGDELLPSLVVSVRTAPNLSPVAVRQLLRDVLAEEFEQVVVQDEGELQIGFERAYVLSGEVPEQQMSFTQLLLQHGDRCVLIGMQQALPAPPATRRELERCLHSLRFLDNL